MEKPLQIFVRLGVVFIVSFLVASSTTVVSSSPQKELFSLTKQTMNHSSRSSDETELKYYMEEGLSTVVGVCSSDIRWKSAIRLTQDEMAAYTDWTMTKVNVAFSADNGCPYIYIRIYIYDKGDSPTRPGPVIVSDTTAKLSVTGITTVPLVTPVNLSGHEELWVAVEWNDTWEFAYYAWLDTLTGPHVWQKGDFYCLNNSWLEIWHGGADYDGNWGIGAIIEGSDFAELSIGNFKGPVGITANVSNIGVVDAGNISWSILITGGLLHRINVMETGNASSLLAGSSTTISTGLFFGVGKILITATAVAENALEVTATKTAFLLGSFVLRIK